MTLIDFGYSPLAIHRNFHLSTAGERCMFGGYGSGKTWALCAEAIAFMLEQPGSEIVIIRKTVPSLRDTTEAIFVQLLPDAFFKECEKTRGGGHYQSITFPNGSEVKFRSIPTPADWLKLKSLSVAGLFFDEVDELDQESYEGMVSRLRQVQPLPKAKKQGAPPIKRRMICSASNPAGHNWVWDRFVGPDALPDTHFQVSRTIDNPTLPISYVQKLLAMPDPWVRRYVLCSFDEFGGAIYPDFAYDTHVIQPLTEYDPENLFLMSFDPGTAAGNAAIWAYHDKKTNRLICVAEYLETGLAALVHATAWRKIEAKFGMRVRRRIADPKAIPIRDRGSNITLKEIYRKLGFRFTPGENALPNRLNSLGQLIHLGRFVLTTDCPQLYEQIKNARWEDITPTMRAKGREPKPVKKNSDLHDAAQYLACEHLSPAQFTPEEQIDDDMERFQSEMRAAIRAKLGKSRTATQSHDLGSIRV